MKFGNIRAVGQIIATGSLVSNAVTLITGSAQLTGLGFATTGSNTFLGNQTITIGGSTELQVQQSGVTIGNIVTDVHRLTGSLNMSGSQTINGTLGVSIGGVTELNVQQAGVTLGNVITDTHRVTGSLNVSGSITTTGNVSAGTTFNWNGGIGALSYGSGVVTLETNTANAIQLKTNGTAAITISTGQTATFANNIGLGVTPITKLHLQGSSPNYILLTNTAADGVGNAIQGGIIGQSRGYSNNLSQMASILFRNENSAAWYKGEITFNTNGSDGTNPAVSPTERLRIASGGNIGVNDPAPSKLLTVNFGTNISDGLLVTGTQRQETRFKSSGEHSNVFIDSGHSNIYLPTLALLRSGSSFGEVKLQRASNSDSVGSFTESEMIMGSTTSVPVSIKTNEVRRIVIASGGAVTVHNSLSVNGNFGARNFNNAIKSWSTNGSYTWSTELSAISGYFDSACWYKGFIRESNGAHYYGYQFDIHVGQIGYGGASSQFIVRNMTYAGGPWTGGCGGSSFAAIDNSGFTKQNSGCFDSLELFITRLG
jgi:hypothetical protein